MNLKLAKQIDIFDENYLYCLAVAASNKYLESPITKYMQNLDWTQTSKSNPDAFLSLLDKMLQFGGYYTYLFNYAVSVDPTDFLDSIFAICGNKISDEQLYSLFCYINLNPVIGKFSKNKNFTISYLSNVLQDRKYSGTDWVSRFSLVYKKMFKKDITNEVSFNEEPEKIASKIANLLLS